MLYRMRVSADFMFSLQAKNEDEAFTKAKKWLENHMDSECGFNVECDSHLADAMVYTHLDPIISIET